MKVYVVGKVTGDSDSGVEHSWEVCGIYTDEVVAVRKCKTAEYFVGPAELDEDMPEERVSWLGGYYPKEKVE